MAYGVIASRRNLSVRWKFPFGRSYFLVTIQLRYYHAPHEWHDFEPNASEPEAYLVTESSGYQRSGEVKLGGSATGPVRVR
jgi:hypothetical protein